MAPKPKKTYEWPPGSGKFLSLISIAKAECIADTALRWRINNGHTLVDSVAALKAKSSKDRSEEAATPSGWHTALSRRFLSQPLLRHRGGVQ